MDKKVRALTEENHPSENVNRLLRHLKEGTLAARLVCAYHLQSTEQGNRAMEEVLEERLRRIREALSDGKS